MEKNENENETGEATFGGALRAPLAGSLAFVFVFVLIYVEFEFSESIFLNYYNFVD